MELLSSIDLFRELDDDLLSTLASSATEKIYLKSTPVFKQGDAADAFFIIRSGRVAIEREGKQLATLTSGAIFGEMGAIDGKPRGATARTVERSVLVKVQRFALLQLGKKRPSVEMRIRRRIIERHHANISRTFSKIDID